MDARVAAVALVGVDARPGQRERPRAGRAVGERREHGAARDRRDGWVEGGDGLDLRRLDGVVVVARRRRRARERDAERDRERENDNAEPASLLHVPLLRSIGTTHPAAARPPGRGSPCRERGLSHLRAGLATAAVAAAAPVSDDRPVPGYNDGSRRAPGALRHDAARGAARGAVPRAADDRRRRPRVHRAQRHVLPRDRGRARDGRSARTRAATPASSACWTSGRSRSRSTTATACSCRPATLLVNPHVGLLFIDFEERTRLRLNGVASIDDDDPLLAEYPEAQLVVRVRGDARCSRTARATSTATSSSSGRGSCRARAARRRCREWKRSEWARGRTARDRPGALVRRRRSPRVGE